MHDRVTFTDQMVDEVGIADVTAREPDTVGDRVEVAAISGVGQRVQHGHFRVWVPVDRIQHEVRADEAGPTCDKHPPHAGMLHASKRE